MAPRRSARNSKRTLPNIVPSHLVCHIQGTEPQNMSVRGSNNNLWHMKIEKFGDDWYFTDGYTKFVKDNMIKYDDVVLYEYTSQGLLDFKNHGPPGHQDDEVECLGNRTTNDFCHPELQDEGIQVKVEDEEASDDINCNPPRTWDVHHRKEKMVDVKEEEVSDDIDSNLPKERNSRPRKRKVVNAVGSASTHRTRGKNQDFFGTEIFSSGQIPMPTNPYFVANTKEDRLNEMYIPADVMKYNELKLPEEIKAVDSEGRMFRSRRKSYPDGRVIYYGGWKALRKVNLVTSNDKLICEFIAGEGGVLHINVSVFRARNI